MTWNYGNTIDTVVGGLVTIKVMETGMNMIDRASKIGSTNSRKKGRKKTNNTTFHKFGSSLF